MLFYCLLLLSPSCSSSSAGVSCLLSTVSCLLSPVACASLVSFLPFFNAAAVSSCCCCRLILLLLLSLLLPLSLCVSFDLLFIEVGLLRVLLFILLYFLSPFCCRFCSVCLSPFHVFVCSLPSSLVSLYFICLAFRSLLSPCFLCFICFFSSFLFFLFMFIIYYLGLALFVVISAAGVCACTHPQP